MHKRHITPAPPLPTLSHPPFTAVNLLPHTPILPCSW
jgi:hypothetical protein